VNTLEFLTDVLGVAGKHLLDVGCGEGALAKALVSKGARITGMDPMPAAIEKARHFAPLAQFTCAPAQRMPFPDGHFEGAIFLNSLHHIPGVSMRDALREAVRVSAPGARIAVIEPLAEGSFFEAFKLIDDETEVRHQAQAALQAAVAEGDLRLAQSITFIRSESFQDFEAFAARAAAVEPERLIVIRAHRAAVEAAFEAHALRDADGRFRLDQPLKADLYTGV
jgi:ubiquinone/menaquinone biosynthesis C-methylase UbiE